MTTHATPSVTAIDHVQLAIPAGREDDAALVAVLRTGGHAVVEDGPVEGHDRVYVDDPFGNRIELIEEGNG